MSKIKIQSTVYPPTGKPSFNEWHISIRDEIASGKATIERETLYIIHRTMDELLQENKGLPVSGVQKLKEITEIALQ